MSIHTDPSINDTFHTIQTATEATFTEKRSKFISYAYPVKSVDEIKEHLAVLQKKYYDARHICYAYVLGPERKEFRANDNGEPSGTAGKPILGQINSRELTDIFVAVVRYFGGIKLGTGGLIVAYREGASLALDEAEIITCTVDEELTVKYEYPLMNEVMRVVKEEEPTVVSQQFEMDCRLTLSTRASAMPHLRQRMEDIHGVTIVED